MLITKEQQEALVNQYIKEKHTTDECIGFIDGINKMLELLDKIAKNNFKLIKNNKSPNTRQKTCF